MFNVIILDLSMPILNGFDACTKIGALFKDIKSLKFESNNLDKNKKILSVSMSNSSNLIQSSDSFGYRASMNSQDLVLKPVMIACSGYLDEKTQENIENCGFDDFFIAPLNRNNICDNILSLIEIREQKMKNQVHLQSLMGQHAHIDMMMKSSGINSSSQMKKHEERKFEFK